MEDIRTELMKYITTLGVQDVHAAETIAHDVLLDSRTKGYEFKSAKYKSLDYFKRKKVENRRYLYMDGVLGDEDEFKLENILKFDDISEMSDRMLKDQRELIMYLSKTTDERTKSIIKTFLTSDKPTKNNVAKHLGLGYEQVNRCLRRLSKEFDENIFGSLEEYINVWDVKILRIKVLYVRIKWNGELYLCRMSWRLLQRWYWRHRRFIRLHRC